MKKLSNEWLAGKMLDLANAVIKLNERVTLLENDKYSSDDLYPLYTEMTELKVDMIEIIEDINKFAEEKTDE